MRSVISLWPLLTVQFQTELVVNERANSSGARRDVAGTRTVIPTTREDTANTRRAVPTIRDGATNTQPTISNAQNDVVNTHAPVSDTYRSISRRQEGTRDDRHSVNATIYPSVTQCSPFPRLVAGQRPPVTRTQRSRQYF